jgi:hypothetical protein
MEQLTKQRMNEMALIITIQNDLTGTDQSANYAYKVFVNKRQIDEGTIKGHNRADHWRKLVVKVIENTEPPQGKQKEEEND